jgi:predicted GNAT family acetyltransferase
MPSQVRNNTERGRFELDTEAGLAVALYRLSPGIMTVYHTEVPIALRWGGIGERLVRGVLEEARRLDLRIVPACPFVRAVIDRHPEFQDLLR